MHKPTLIKILKMLDVWDEATHGPLIDFVLNKSIAHDASLDVEKLRRGANISKVFIDS